MGEFYEKLHKDATFGDTGFKVNTAPSGKLPTSDDYTTDKDVAELVDATIKYLTSRFSTSMEPPLSYFNAMNVPLWPYDSEELETSPVWSTTTGFFSQIKKWTTFHLNGRL